MEKRFILFIILVFLVFFGFQYFMPKPQNSQSAPTGQAATAPETEGRADAPSAPVPAAPAPDGAPAAAATATPGDGAAVPASGDAAPPAAEDTQADAQKIVIDGGLYTAVLDNRGGVLTSWELKGYQTTKSKEEPGRTFDMVTGAARNERLYPGALILGGDAAEKTANNECYQVSVEGGGGDGQGKLAPPVTVKLSLKRGDLQIEKVWSFDKDNYTASLQLAGTKAGKPLEGRFFLGEDIGPASEHFTSKAAGLSAVYSLGGKVKRESPDDPGELKRFEGDVRWAGLDMPYFSLIAIPERPLGHFNTQTTRLEEAGIDGKTVERDLLKVTLPLAASGGDSYRFYIGPKKQENLKAVGATDLSGVIDYGMFAILVYPFLAVLRWLYQYVNNYGWAIVILTFALSLILFPFRLKSVLSAKKMSAVQPKVKAIQDKYRQYKATDPRKREMNTEVMALYKEHGVNPMGGCLPLLLQLPILWAFYSLLSHTIDLRQAPFIWWLTDLSAKDPYYILPIAMALTQFLSQKMMPTPSTDPTQAKVMMLMPLVFVFVFLNMSSGLNLYFLCSNIFSVAFQKISERWIPAATAVPAKGPAKGAGKGKGK